MQYVLRSDLEAGSASVSYSLGLSIQINPLMLAAAKGKQPISMKCLSQRYY